MLDDMAGALQASPDRPLAFAPSFAGLLRTHIPALRSVVAVAVTAGLPVPALAATLAYFDSIRQARGTANMIQAQRDFFGAHGVKRTDRPGASGLNLPWPPLG